MGASNTCRICVPVCVSELHDIAPAVKLAESIADIIEVRIDCIKESDFETVRRFLGEVRLQTRTPIIFTLRPVQEGGRAQLDRSTRISFWCVEAIDLLNGGGNFADIEFELLTDLTKAEACENLPNWSNVICSYHDFTGVPDDLETIYERMAKSHARVIKIAVKAKDVTDCIPVMKLLASGKKMGRATIAVAMDRAGLMTRILGPAHGSFLTYGSLDPVNATAPGQISAKDLRELYRVHRIDSKTEVMGLVGRPVGHSVSPHLHNAAFSFSDYNAVYIPFEVSNVMGFMDRMVNPNRRELAWNLRGLSVTAPHKIAIMDYLDWVDPIAREVGAVNTVVIEGKSVLGYNTDVAAMLNPLRLFIEVSRASVAVIGAGGVARALLWSLRNAGARVTVFARDIERVTAMASEFGASVANLNGASFEGFDVVVNATPLGTSGVNEQATPATAEQLIGVKLAYDLVYNPLETRFMREARKAGCQCMNGLEMFVAQAAEQFRIWTGAEAPIEVMRMAAEKALRK